MEIPVQVNGKLRDKITIPPTRRDRDIDRRRKRRKSPPLVGRKIHPQEALRPNKLVNFVVA